MKSIISGTVCVLLTLAISACSGSSESMPTLPTAGTLTAGATSSAAQVEGAPVVSGRPSQIMVFPFATSTADVTLNQGLGAKLYREYTDNNQTADQAQLARATAQNICTRVATSLASNGWNAACQPRGTPVTDGNTLIVDGIFTDISQGNRAERMVIGLGVGASVVDTRVTVYQYSNGNSVQLMTFTTHADSGMMPGVGITGPAGAAAGGAAAAATLGVDVASSGVKSVTSSTGYLADQSAKQIVSQANNYFSQEGWSSTPPNS
ncbi:MAG: DUF4410 domain-containing protein [Candidatus Binataceae bacterium]